MMWDRPLCGQAAAPRKRRQQTSPSCKDGRGREKERRRKEERERADRVSGLRPWREEYKRPTQARAPPRCEHWPSVALRPKAPPLRRPRTRTGQERIRIESSSSLMFFLDMHVRLEGAREKGRGTHSTLLGMALLLPDQRRRC